LSGTAAASVQRHWQQKWFEDARFTTAMLPVQHWFHVPPMQEADAKQYLLPLQSAENPVSLTPAVSHAGHTT
jgi:hypothetical protein